MRSLEYSDFLNIENFNENINFWLVRTNGGRFYDEYKENGFIALGWNYVDSNNINEDNEDEIKLIKEQLEILYDKKSGSTIFNKCIRFINEMKVGDIVMVPSGENEEIFFARVGEYYETDADYGKEIEILKRINAKEDFGITLKCPYKKRRYIKIIKVVKGTRLNPNLFRALTSSHGISNINKYSDFVLSSIYNLYVRDNKLNMVVNIEQSAGIDGYDFSSIIYNICKMAKLSDQSVKVITQANVNSPGDLINIIETANNIFDFIKANWIGILFVYGALCGVKIGPIDIPSFIEFIFKRIKDKKEIEREDAEIKGVLLNNQMKSLELEIARAKWDDEKFRKAREIAVDIEKSATNLKVDREASSRVINVDFKTNDE